MFYSQSVPGHYHNYFRLLFLVVVLTVMFYVCPVHCRVILNVPPLIAFLPAQISMSNPLVGSRFP
jgi:hypothetical protein